MTPTPFPTDANGEVLRIMAKGGDDLSRARPIEFAVVVPDQAAAERLTAALAGRDLAIRTAELEESLEGCTWEVLVSRDMVPTHGGITEFEAELAALAEPLGGWNDGWGCMPAGWAAAGS
jgi:hypothetical protein